MRRIQAAKAITSTLRTRVPFVASDTSDFHSRCYGVLVRLSRALAAQEAGLREEAHRHLEDLFAFLNSHFPRLCTPEECRAVMGAKAAETVSEDAFPIIVLKMLAHLRVRLPDKEVPSYMACIGRFQEVVMTA